MENLKLKIRKIIAESFLPEAKLSSHLLDDRFLNRFLTKGEKSVGYEIPGSKGEYQEVGTKKLEDAQIEDVRNKLGIIEKYSFPKNKSYAIKLSDLFIQPQSVNFLSPELLEKSKGKTLVYVDRNSSSNGNVVYVIIRDNEARTIMFSKSYSNITSDKFNVDYIIKDFNNITSGKVR